MNPKKPLVVNGSELTELESLLLSLGDVVDTDDLRDVQALRRLQAERHILSRHRLQRQIDALEAAAVESARAVIRASRP